MKQEGTYFEKKHIPILDILLVVFLIACQPQTVDKYVGSAKSNKYHYP